MEVIFPWGAQWGNGVSGGRSLTLPQEELWAEGLAAWMGWMAPAPGSTLLSPLLLPSKFGDVILSRICHPGSLHTSAAKEGRDAPFQQIGEVATETDTVDF